jgi:hypothetical protein
MAQQQIGLASNSYAPKQLRKPTSVDSLNAAYGSKGTGIPEKFEYGFNEGSEALTSSRHAEGLNYMERSTESNSSPVSPPRTAKSSPSPKNLLDMSPKLPPRPKPMPIPPSDL